MKERDKPSVFIKLTPLQVKKIEVMKKSIQEPVTRKDIIDGLIESAYVVALNTLYDERLLSKRTYEDGLKLVPDYYLGEI